MVRHAVADVPNSGDEVFAGSLKIREVFNIEYCLRFEDAVCEGRVCGCKGAVVEVECGEVS